MIKTKRYHYLLSPILDHKEKYDLNGIEIHIAKEYENNLRSRNCQIGIVEAVPETNPLNLEIGDRVFVNHFTFHGDIGDNRAFELEEHVDYEGKKIFKVPEKKILFKYNNEVIQVVGNTIILEAIYSEAQTSSVIKVDPKQYKDRGRVIYGNDDYKVGQTVFVERNALYDLELKGEKYFKVFSNEIVGIEQGDEILPTEGRVVLEDEESFTSDFLDLSFVKKKGTVKAKIVKKGKISKNNDWIKEGDIVLRGRDYGVRYKNQYIVTLADENIHGVFLDGKEGIENLKIIV